MLNNVTKRRGHHEQINETNQITLILHHQIQIKAHNINITNKKVQWEMNVSQSNMNHKNDENTMNPIQYN